MENFGFAAPPSENLIPCKICGRTFLKRVLKKHVPICQKSASKKRKVFDSRRQRADGSDIPMVKPLKSKPEPPKKQSNWRRKHEEFIATIRAARSLSKAMKDGGPLPPPPPPSYDPDYIQCPYCQRRFSESAADRHIKFCKEQAARMSNKGRVAGEVKVKPPARFQYKPPPLKKASSHATTAVPTSSRLPQSFVVQSAGGIPVSKSPSAGPTKSLAPRATCRTGTTGPTSLTSPTSRVNVKTKTSTSPGCLKMPRTVAGPTTRKACSVEKFCNECGVKYPVEHTRFCLQCGVKRMCL